MSTVDNSIENLDDLSHTLIPQKKRYLLKFLLEFVTTNLSNLGIEYWITGGTLLGCLRHQDQIPWDDDVDICCHIKDFWKVISGLKKSIEDRPDYFWNFISSDGKPYLSETGLDVKNSSNDLDTVKKGESNFKTQVKLPLKITFPGKATKISGKGFTRYFGLPCLDIFFWNKQKIDNQMIYLDMAPEHRTRWPWDYHYERDLYPLKKYKYNNLIVMGPNNGVPYCNRGYPNWQTQALINYHPEKHDHKELDAFHKVSKTVEISFKDSILSKYLRFDNSVIK